MSLPESIGLQVSSNRVDPRSASLQFQTAIEYEYEYEYRFTEYEYDEIRCTNDPHWPSTRRRLYTSQKRSIEYFGPMLCSCFFPYSYSASRYSYSIRFDSIRFDSIRFDSIRFDRV